MKFVPRIVYNGITINLTVPQEPWTPAALVVGGSDKSAAGVPESFVVRTEELCEVKLRFTEAELPSVMAWLKWAQKNSGSFTYRFDKNDIATEYTCYLESPAINAEIKPSRAEFKRHFGITLKLRTTTGVVFDERIYT